MATPTAKKGAAAVSIMGFFKAPGASFVSPPAKPATVAAVVGAGVDGKKRKRDAEVDNISTAALKAGTTDGRKPLGECAPAKKQQTAPSTTTVVAHIQAPTPAPAPATSTVPIYIDGASDASTDVDTPRIQAKAAVASDDVVPMDVSPGPGVASPAAASPVPVSPTGSSSPSANAHANVNACFDVELRKGAMGWGLRLRTKVDAQVKGKSGAESDNAIGDSGSSASGSSSEAGADSVCDANASGTAAGADTAGAKGEHAVLEVAKVVPNGVAARSGRLLQGDVILSMRADTATSPSATSTTATATADVSASTWLASAVSAQGVDAAASAQAWLQQQSTSVVFSIERPAAVAAAALAAAASMAKKASSARKPIMASKPPPAAHARLVEFASALVTSVADATRLTRWQCAARRLPFGDGNDAGAGHDGASGALSPRELSAKEWRAAWLSCASVRAELTRLGVDADELTEGDADTDSDSDAVADAAAAGEAQDESGNEHENAQPFPDALTPLLARIAHGCPLPCTALCSAALPLLRRAAQASALMPSSTSSSSPSTSGCPPSVALASVVRKLPCMAERKAYGTRSDVARTVVAQLQQARAKPQASNADGDTGIAAPVTPVSANEDTSIAACWVWEAVVLSHLGPDEEAGARAAQKLCSARGQVVRALGRVLDIIAKPDPKASGVASAVTSSFCDDASVAAFPLMLPPHAQTSGVNTPEAKIFEAEAKVYKARRALESAQQKLDAQQQKVREAAQRKAEREEQQAARARAKEEARADALRRKEEEKAQREKEKAEREAAKRRARELKEAERKAEIEAKRKAREEALEAKRKEAEAREEAKQQQQAKQSVMRFFGGPAAVIVPKPKTVKLTEEEAQAAKEAATAKAAAEEKARAAAAAAKADARAKLVDKLDALLFSPQASCDGALALDALRAQLCQRCSTVTARLRSQRRERAAARRVRWRVSDEEKGPIEVPEKDAAKSNANPFAMDEDENMSANDDFIVPVISIAAGAAQPTSGAHVPNVGIGSGAESSSGGDGRVVDCTKEAPAHLTRAHFGRWKMLQFDEDVRPAYFGTWHKQSITVGARQPLGRDEVLDYEFDSEGEWEDEDPGESLSGSDAEDGEEGEDEYDYDNDKWLARDHEGVARDDDMQDLADAAAEGAEEEGAQAREVVVVGLDYSGNIASLAQCVPLGPRGLLAMAAAAASDGSTGSLQKDQGNGRVSAAALTDAMLPSLFSLLHGNVLGREKIVEDWLAEAAASGRMQESELPAKTLLRRKINEVAAKEKRVGDAKPRWYVRADVLEAAKVDGTAVLKPKLEAEAAQEAAKEAEKDRVRAEKEAAKEAAKAEKEAAREQQRAAKEAEKEKAKAEKEAARAAAKAEREAAKTAAMPGVANAMLKFVKPGAKAHLEPSSVPSPTAKPQTATALQKLLAAGAKPGASRTDLKDLKAPDATPMDDVMAAMMDTDADPDASADMDTAVDLS